MTDLAGLQLLRRIEEGVAGKSGEAFFRQIVRELTLALDAHAAFTSRLLPDRRAQMLAFWVDGGRYEKCNNYSLAGTPCEFVYNGRITSFARDIGNVFPVDREWFEQLGVHSYLGVPIVSETGEVHGHLAVMDKPERDWRDADVDILRLFSLRTAVELERAKAHRMLEDSRASWHGCSGAACICSRFLRSRAKRACSSNGTGRCSFHPISRTWAIGARVAVLLSQRPARAVLPMGSLP